MQETWTNSILTGLFKTTNNFKCLNDNSQLVDKVNISRKKRLLQNFSTMYLQLFCQFFSFNSFLWCLLIYTEPHHQGLREAMPCPQHYRRFWWQMGSWTCWPEDFVLFTVWDSQESESLQQHSYNKSQGTFQLARFTPSMRPWTN